MAEGEGRPERIPGERVDSSAPPKERTLQEVFAGIEEIRERVKPLPKGMTIKDLIEEGRR